MEMLTVRQVAEVKECSLRHIQKSIADKKLKAVETVNDRNRKTYLIPVTELDEESQYKWHLMSRDEEAAEVLPKAEKPPKEIDHFSHEERAEIDFWMELVEKWQNYRAMPGVTTRQVLKGGSSMSKEEKKMMIERMAKKFTGMDTEDKSFIVGYMTGKEEERLKWEQTKTAVAAIA